MLLDKAYRSIIPANKKKSNYASPSIERMREILDDTTKVNEKGNHLLKRNIPKLADEFNNLHGGISSLYTFTARNLISPSYCESLALIFILASDRVQTSSLQNMKLEDFDITDKELLYTHYKHRSNSELPKTSPIYVRRTIIYKL